MWPSSIIFLDAGHGWWRATYYQWDFDSLWSLLGFNHGGLHEQSNPMHLSDVPRDVWLCFLISACGTMLRLRHGRSNYEESVELFFWVLELPVHGETANMNQLFRSDGRVQCQSLLFFNAVLNLMFSMPFSSHFFHVACQIISHFHSFHLLRVACHLSPCKSLMQSTCRWSHYVIAYVTAQPFLSKP